MNHENLVYKLELITNTIITERSHVKIATANKLCIHKSIYIYNNLSNCLFFFIIFNSYLQISILKVDGTADSSQLFPGLQN